MTLQGYGNIYSCLMVNALTKHLSSTSSGTSSSAWLTSAAVIAACALLFTIASFWWLNARRGSLKSFAPHTFAIAITPALVRLRFPLVLYNTGAIPLIVQNLRVSFQHEQGSVPLPWITTRSQIRPDSNEGNPFAAVFSVAGRTAHQIFAEFGAPSLGFSFEARNYSVRIDVKLGHKKKWKSLLEFPLQAGQIEDPNRYITYRNDPGELGDARELEA